MKVAVVGAGMAGLAAARTLASSGTEVVVFEKSSGPGGRVATRRLGPYIFDSGATSIAPRGMSIEKEILSVLPTENLVRIEKGIFTHASLRVSSGDPAKNATARYTYKPGINELGKLLARDLDVRYDSQIDALAKVGAEFKVGDEAFGAVILTPPIPQTSALLWTLNESRPLANARYRACISIMIGVESGVPETHYHALLEPEQRHPLTFLAIESAKCPGRAPEGGAALVAQMSPEYSRESYDKPDAALVQEVMVFLRRLYPQISEPVQSSVKRWKYSHPESVALFESVNQPGDRLIIAGDGVLAGRTEAAYESGVKAARLILENQ